MLYAIFPPPMIVKSSFTFVGEVDRAQIMYVCSLYVRYLSEYTLLCHIQCGQCKWIVATVFKHHTVLPCLLGCIYQLPAFFYGHGCRNFDGYVFTVFHSINCHGSMCQPIGTDKHQVNIIPFTHLFPSIRPGITIRLGIACFPENFLRFSQVTFPDFA